MKKYEYEILEYTVEEYSIPLESIVGNLDQMGEGCWELTQVVHIGNTVRFFFKREQL